MKFLPTAILLSVTVLTIVSGNEEELPDPERALNERIAELGHKDVEVRRNAAKTLGGVGADAKEAIPALIEALEDNDEYVRATAGRALGKIGPGAESAIAALMQAIKDPVVIVRMGAASGLGGIGPTAKAAIPALAEALQRQDEDHNVKNEAAEALGKIGPKAIPALAKALANTQHFVRRISARALGEIGGAAGVPSLIKALKDDDRNVRSITAKALGKIGVDAKGAIPALRRALGDEYYSVRWRATRSLWLIRTGRKKTQNMGVFPHGEAKDGLAAFLLSQKDRFAIGEPIPLSYGLIFVGPGLEHRSKEAYELQAIRVWRPWAPMNPRNASWFEVRGPDGASVPYQGWHLSGAVTKPSDENTALLRYGDLIGRPHNDLCEGGAFHLSEAGIYRVQWFYKPFPIGELWSGKLESNEVQIEILADREVDELESAETDEHERKD